MKSHPILYNLTYSPERSCTAIIGGLFLKWSGLCLQFPCATQILAVLLILSVWATLFPTLAVNSCGQSKGLLLGKNLLMAVGSSGSDSCIQTFARCINVLSGCSWDSTAGRDGASQQQQLLHQLCHHTSCGLDTLPSHVPTHWGAVCAVQNPPHLQ